MSKIFLVFLVFVCLLILSQFRFSFLSSQGVIPAASSKRALVLKNRHLASLPIWRQKVVLYRDKNTIYISRLIGFPGETVSLDSGHVFINQAILEEKYLSSLRTQNTDFDITLDNDSVYLMGDVEGLYQIPGLVNKSAIVGVVLILF